jgi:hypothetical protein
MLQVVIVVVYITVTIIWTQYYVLHISYYNLLPSPMYLSTFHYHQTPLGRAVFKIKHHFFLNKQNYLLT